MNLAEPTPFRLFLYEQFLHETLSYNITESHIK